MGASARLFSLFESKERALGIAIIDTFPVPWLSLASTNVGTGVTTGQSQDIELTLDSTSKVEEVRGP